MLKKLPFVLLVVIGALAFCSCPPPEVPDGSGPGPLKGYALAIGLKTVDPEHYGGWDGELSGCEPDAADMAKIATDQGMNVDTLITANATREAVLSKLSNLADKLNSGELLVVSYSGHGGQIPDQNDDEEDQMDETWCLYNGQLLDDELNQAWSKFRDGVRILVFSDSCHSGTVLKMIKSDYKELPQVRIDELTQNLKTVKSQEPLRREGIRSYIKRNGIFRNRIRDFRPDLKSALRDQEVSDAEVDAVVSLSDRRIVPPDILRNTYKNNKVFYDNIGRVVPKEDPSVVRASVILISGCQDDQGALDVGTNGLFTLILKQVWNNGAFNGSHLKFHIDIRSLVLGMDDSQSPNFFTIGAQDDVFIQQRPYTITL